MAGKAATLSVRAIGDSSGVILPKATLKHLGVSRGQSLSRRLFRSCRAHPPR